MGRHCREWPAGKAGSHSLHRDGSVTKDQSGWGFTVKQGATTIHEDSAAYQVSTCSLTMEMEAATHALRWIASRGDSHTAHSAIVLTYSMSLLQKVKRGMGSPVAMFDIHLRGTLWVYCSGHAGVKGNDRADTETGGQSNQPAQAGCISEDLKC